MTLDFKRLRLLWSRKHLLVYLSHKPSVLGRSCSNRTSFLSKKYRGNEDGSPLHMWGLSCKGLNWWNLPCLNISHENSDRVAVNKWCWGCRVENNLCPTRPHKHFWTVKTEKRTMCSSKVLSELVENADQSTPETIPFL